MDSFSDSCDLLVPKIESGTEPAESRVAKVNWTPDNTLKLIETLEQYPELWNMKHPGYRNKPAKQIKFEVLANMFNTTTGEIGRKIHNLKTQFNNELRKIRKRQGEGAGTSESGWEYFESLLFLKTTNLNDSTQDPLGFDAVSLELTDSQEEDEAGRAKALESMNQPMFPWRNKSGLRVADTMPPPMPPTRPQGNPSLWPEQHLPRLNNDTDECQIFGDFVASELRMMTSNESRNKLRRLILKVIMQAADEDRPITMS